MAKKSFIKPEIDCSDDLFADADKDDHYGLVRDPNFHDWEYCNRRLRCRFIDACNGTGDGDCLDDPSATVVCLRPMLPSPSRELSYKPRTGWRYEPSNRYTKDRLGTGVAEANPRQKQKGQQKNAKKNDAAALFPMPSTKMIIPVSWTSGLFPGRMTEARKRGCEFDSEKLNTRKMITGRIIESNLRSNKKQRMSRDYNDAATVVTNSTADDAEHVSRVIEGDRVKQDSAVVPVKGLPTLFLATNASIPSPSVTLKHQKQQKTASNDSGIATTRLGSPKEVLYQWYGKKPRKIQIKAGQYMTWNNGRLNDQLFSTIFVCPMTQEAFLAGPRSGAGPGTTHDKDGIYWFPRKIMAEHAAAARALDCFVMRESGGGNNNRGRLGGLEPYWPSQRPEWPIERIPGRILENLTLEQYVNNSKNAKNANKNKDVHTVQKSTITKSKDVSTTSSDENEMDRRNDKGGGGGGVGQDNTSRNYGGGHRQRQSSWRRGNHSDNFLKNKLSKTQDVQHYRAQRMPNGQRAGHSHTTHEGMGYQPRQEEQQIDPSIHSYLPYNSQSATRQNGQFVSTVSEYGQHPVTQTIQQQQSSGRNHFTFPHHHQQYKYFEHQQGNNHLQHGGNINNHQSVQLNQQQLIPPPPPQPNGSFQNYPTGWNGQNRHDQNRFQNHF